ncbi:hypothetical protein LTR15_012057 [Elasticomyces elasticus]|nr:hypothetical protein LTR15_012057 [Elasticomyces elasticus]
MASINDRDAPKVHLYAEHLQNIRTLSIQASLATVSNAQTKATLSADHDYLTLEHEGESATIRLPISLGSHNDATLTIPAAPTKDLSFRLNIEEKSGQSSLLGRGAPDSENVIPWMASGLTPETALSCSACQAEIVHRGQIRQWRDLPSEGWAEMMDFWHCHKPDEPHDHSGGVSNTGRGFASHSKLIALEAIGLVGPMDFLLSTTDCTNLEASTSLSPSVLVCTGCKTCIGVFDSSTQGNKLRKSALIISTSSSSHTLRLPLEKWLSSALLTAAESQGVRWLVVYAAIAESEPAQHVMRLWVFAPDLTVSSSAADSPEGTRVVKVLYRNGVPGDVARSESMGGSEGELELSQAEWHELRSLLERSAGLLPEKARAFQQWSVALLRRFVHEDIGAHGL